MSNDQERKTCFTNMQENDPIIEKFMKEYLQEKASAGQGDSLGSDELVVNFDVSYADGKSQSFTCGSESKVFTGNDSGYIETKVDAEEMKCYFGDNDINITIDEIDSGFDSVREPEKEKWLNCEEEWSESPKNNHKSYGVKKKDWINGKVTVVSTLSSRDGSKIKGIKINLYKLNGISPELIESKVTDLGGRVVFDNIPEGSYRVIQLIDKRYFEKPCYDSWNEVTINSSNRETEIFAINNVKDQFKKTGWKYYK